MSSIPSILEPLSTGDIIDRSVRIYRTNLRPLLATVALPFVVGSVGGLMMKFGRNRFTFETLDVPSVLLLVGGFAVWLLYGYLMVLTVAGLSRTVGDYIMLGEPITVRASVRAVRRRLGPLTVAALIFAAAAVVTGALAVFALTLVMMVTSLLGLALQWLGFPPVVSGVLVAIGMIVAVLASLFYVVPTVIARVVFLPQAIMIEGSSASAALARAASLGGRNWNRVLGILLFSYFASYSLTAAVAAPFALLLWLTGQLQFDQETLDAALGGVIQFASCLVVPVWAISYTLLYFDNRVRKEAYDVDLLARRLPPAPPRAATPTFAETAPAAPALARRKFAADGRCLRCGRVNLFDSPNCPGCGW
jgi:hypothetical protein